jgi:TRAP-type C4-dicarboxylate transport system substrate-binding protein
MEGSRMRKAGLVVVLISVLGLASAVWSATPPARPTIELNEDAAVGGPQEVALKELSREVARATHGRLVIHVHLNGGLGGPQESVENMMFGDLKMFSGAVIDYLPLMIDEVSGLDTPFLIPGEDPARRYLRSPLLDEAREKVLHSRRIRFLEMTAIRSPFHLIAARRPISSAADLQGLRITFTKPLTKTAIRLWSALGAIYVPPMPTAELKAALKSGRIDAIIVSDVESLSRENLVTAAPNLIGVDDCPQIWQISINEPLWQSLTLDEQAALATAADGSARVFEREARRRFQKDIRLVTSVGRATFVQLDVAGIRQQLQPTYAALAAEGGVSPRVLQTANAAAAP